MVTSITNGFIQEVFKSKIDKFKNSQGVKVIIQNSRRNLHKRYN